MDVTQILVSGRAIEICDWRPHRLYSSCVAGLLHTESGALVNKLYTCYRPTYFIILLFNLPIVFSYFIYFRDIISLLLLLSLLLFL